MRRAFLCSSAACVAAAALVACGGGGGGSATPPTSSGGSMTATATPSPSASGYAVSGTVVQIPSDAYGPTTIDGVTYASADAGQTTPLVGATVIVGPVPIVGATAPAVLPAGDVAMTTTSSGAFSGAVLVAPGAVSSSGQFVLPQLNLSGAIIPVTGYYVEVFARSISGSNPSATITLHKFISNNVPLSLRISTPTSAESAALLQVNSDRQFYAGLQPLSLDEIAEEAARLHASDESANNYYCHYDRHNVGPTSRYLSFLGLGETGEDIDATTGIDAPSGFQNAENAFMSEHSTSPQGAHYLDIVDSTHLWIGLAAVPIASGGVQVDYELVTPDGIDPMFASSGYEVGSGCPLGTTENNS